MSVSVADRLATALKAAGFSTCFGYLSYHIERLPQALLKAGCRVVIAASETGAGYMAQGLALVSGRPALAFCGGSPGLAMLLPALQVARLEGIPLLAIVGQTGSDGLPTFQDTGAAGSRDRELVAALGIANLNLAAAADLPAILQSAWALLQEAAPVVLTIPCDLLGAPWSAEMEAPSAGAAAPWQKGKPGAGSTCAQASPSVRSNSGPPRGGGYRAVVVELMEHLPADTLWFGDAGQPRHAMGMELGRRGIPFFESASTGPMGWALAAAIGAASHEPARRVCCFTGDGSALMLANEWSTAVKLQLPITFVLAENGVLGGPYGRLRESGSESLGRLAELNWCALAAAMGLPAWRIDATHSLPEGLAALPPIGPRLLVVPLPERDRQVQPPYSLAHGAPIARDR
jgi:thiamine pyrophosphate-dependent acetolactate synthase large subunit-like protein